MTLRDLNRIDTIALANRRQRVMGFLRHASGYTVVLTFAAMCVLPIGAACLATGKDGTWQFACVLLAAAIAVAWEMRDPYQRLALLGGNVFVTSPRDCTEKHRAFLGVCPDLAACRNVIKIGVSPVWRAGQGTVTPVQADPYGSNFWKLAIVDGAYIATDANGKRLRCKEAWEVTIVFFHASARTLQSSSGDWAFCV